MMTRIYRRLHLIFSAKFLTICLLTITLVANHAVVTGYQPPSDQKPPSGYSDSSGVR
jgi:hypothetical protein